MNKLSKRQWYGVHSASRAWMIVAGVICVNVLLLTVSLRWDLTANKQYTLAAASQAVVQQLQNPVTLKLYFSADVPQNLLATRQDLDDLLAEYKRVGGANIVLESTDPSTDTEAQAEVQRYGIAKIQYNIAGQNKYEVSTGYAGMAILYGDKYQSLPALPNLPNPEYDITAAIQKLSRTTTPTIGWLSDHGTLPAQAAKQALRQQYTVTPVTLDKLDATLTDLVIAGPTEEFNDAEKTTLDDFVGRGGHIYGLYDGMEIDEQSLQASPNPSNFDDWLTDYGITVSADLVSDFAYAETLTFGDQYFSVLRPYPYWPRLVADGMNANSPITAQIEGFVAPWPSSITIIPRDGLTVTELVKTSAQSAVTAVTADGTNPGISPDAIVQPAADQLGQRLLAVNVVVNSATGKGNIFAISNARFLDDNFIGKNVDNVALLYNAIDATTQDIPLNSIRARATFSRPLDSIADQQKTVIKYSNIFSSVLIVLVLGGGMVWWRKRQARLAIKRYV